MVQGKLRDDIVDFDASASSFSHRLCNFGIATQSLEGEDREGNQIGSNKIMRQVIATDCHSPLSPKTRNYFVIPNSFLALSTKL